jgi:MoaA/NifB/PqqE/SkfB family radical SAM enzyme
MAINNVQNCITKKTVIITGYTCNNNCYFCIDADKRKMTDKETALIKEEMLRAKKRGTTYLEFIGGEPLIRPDIFVLISFAKKLNFKTIFLATNGRMLANTGFARNLVKAGLTDIVFSLHGHQANLHDSLTRVKGSFAELIKGFKAMKKLIGFDHIGSNTTIVKQNFRHLPAIGKFIAGLGIKNAEFIFVDPNYGGAKKNFKNLVPKISVIAPYVRRCLDIGKKNKAYHWHIRYVPLCYFSDHLDQISELEEVKKFQTEHIAPDFVNYEVEKSRAEVGRVKPDKCSPCRLSGQCEGIWVEYIRHYGDKELKPIK